ncbi:SusC/RagA family TonB-linked outer membrane protein [Flavivirga rizhaonensis]|uniref:TonB-dependent receptor n=1 Tax=Flavivirga rizhaonensis TaxID=2559571 RepID=A0A4S1E199_9FLAO|nr:TonB-dependent receptor [Flavivirga rizhaonensis]TGV04376.1 TonB-dependent receptor [Flavivirga rizhaonensis]
MVKQLFFKLKQKCFFSILFLAFTVFQVHAQQNISGEVVDENDVGIPGANVIVKGTTTGSVTDFDGNFSISASPTDVLVISYLGYITQSITVGNQTSIKVTLVQDTAQLDEIVVIGYGTAKKSDVTGAVSQITAKSYEDQPLSRVEEALQGRAAGVTVAKSSGAPGAAIKVRVRGSNSITGNNAPLVVVDGIIGGDLSSLNPNDIASMDVLKDASATAIYGSRGSNGVILVTTKKGSGESKISLDFFTGISTVPNLIPTLNAADFAKIENLRRIRSGGNEIFTDSEISGFENTGGTNYQDLLFQTGITNNLQLSANGSEGKIRYFLSGNYVNQEGIVINTGYEKYSIRANTNAKINDKLKIGLNLFASRAETKNDIDIFGRFQGSEIIKALTWDPTTPLFDENGEYNNYSNKGLASLNYNPIANLNRSKILFINDRLDTNFNLNYNFTDNLSYTLVAGVSIINSQTEKYTTEPPLSDANFSANKVTTHQISNILTWNKIFNKHNIKLTGVYEFSGTKNRYNSFGSKDLTLSNGFYQANLGTPSILNFFSEGAIQSYMGRGEYIFDQKLFLTATVRIDESSVFRPGKRTGTFPSVALAYSLNDLIENVKAFNELKIRVGWGQVGNQSVNPYTTFPTNGAGSQYSFDGSSPTPGSSPIGYGNPELTWETTTQKNIGVDLAFFSGRANLSVDYFNKNTTDLLLKVPVPDTNGGGTILKNIGEVENKGLDIALSGSIIENDNFNWNSTLSISHVKNKVLDLGGEQSIEGGFNSTDGQSRIWNVVEIGKPLGQFQGYTFLGTWKTSEAAEAAVLGQIPGNAKYLRDSNGDYVVSAIGNGTPTFLWGFNNTVTYKNWDLNVFLQGVHGFDVYNTVKGAIVGGTGNHRSFLAVEQLNQWTPTNETEIPAGGQNEYGSSRYVEDGSFIRLSNLTIGYNFKDILGLNSLKVYAGGQNLFLITDYSGYDPEHTSRPSDSTGNSFDNSGNPSDDGANVDVAAGIDTGSYPNPRTVTLGVKIDF